MKTFGEDAASLVWEAGAVAINSIESIVAEERIDCDFCRVPGYLHAELLGDKEERPSLKRDAELAQRLGFPVRYVASVPISSGPAFSFRTSASSIR